MMLLLNRADPELVVCREGAGERERRRRRRKRSRNWYRKEGLEGEDGSESRRYSA